MILMSSRTLSRFTSLVWLIIALSLGLNVSKAYGLSQNIQVQTDQQLREAEQSFDLARQLESIGNIEQALAIYYRLVEEFPNTISYYQQLKQALRNSARYSELLQVIDDHLSLNPNDLQSFVELGDVQLALGQDSLALQSWESVLERFPGNVIAERLVLNHILSNNLLEEGRALLEHLRTIKGDSSFFALDMGYLYTSRMTYDLATDEFLLYLSAQPQSITAVTNQILRFPAEPEVISMLREKLQRNGSASALSILASVEFQNRNFQQVIDLYAQLEVQPEGWFTLGNDLRAEGELGLAQDVMERILSNPDAISLYEQCILMLAEIYEARSKASQIDLPLSGFFQGNRFFALPFIRIANPRTNLLRQAMVLYDSLITTWRNPQAHLRLGDIRYLILDDFDGAMSEFEEIIEDRSASRYYAEAYLRLVDVMIAKGDLAGAEQVRQQAMARLTTRDQLNQVEIKEVELLLLSGDRDSLVAYVGGQLATLGPSDKHFNDLMELATLLGRFEYWPQHYEIFVQSERLLRQNRRSEAIAILNAVLEGEYTPVSPILQYRLAHLYTLQADYSTAEELSLDIPGNTEFSELGLLLAAELADYLLEDSRLASTRYLFFLDTYPISVYSDAVRLRYRELNPEEVL